MGDLPLLAWLDMHKTWAVGFPPLNGFIQRTRGKGLWEGSLSFLGVLRCPSLCLGPSLPTLPAPWPVAAHTGGGWRGAAPNTPHVLFLDSLSGERGTTQQNSDSRRFESHFAEVQLCSSVCVCLP